MKYLKYFESISASQAQKEINDNKEDIIRVLLKYYHEYNDNLTNRIDEFIWSTDMGDDEVDLNCIRTLVDNMAESWGRTIMDFVEVYYDCRGVINAESRDMIQDLNDIFADYDSMGTFKIKKSSDRKDSRYIIDIHIEDILKKIDFIEIINRVEQLTEFRNISYQGSNNHMTIEFHNDYVVGFDED